MGHSAGAQLAALLCTDDQYLTAVGLSLATIKECVAIDGDTYDVPLIIESAPRHRKTLGQSEPKYGHYQKFGGDPAKHRDLSAVYHIDRRKAIPPFLLLHVASGSDTTAQATRLASALKKADVPARVFGARVTDNIRVNSNLGRPRDPSTDVLFEFLADCLTSAADESSIDTSAATRDAPKTTNVSGRDAFQVRTIWTNDSPKSKLTVLTRRGESFTAKYEFAGGLVRQIKGTVKDGRVSWLAKDVRSTGKPGGDNDGLLVSDEAGDRIDFVWKDESNGASGTYTLRLVNQ